MATMNGRRPWHVETGARTFHSRLVRYLWAAPCTAMGVVPALLLCVAGASVRRISGVVEVAFDNGRHPVARLLGRPYAEHLRHVGGSMRIDSVPGRGTTVELTVPLATPRDLGPAQRASAVPSSGRPHE